MFVKVTTPAFVFLKKNNHVLKVYLLEILYPTITSGAVVGIAFASSSSAVDRGYAAGPLRRPSLLRDSAVIDVQNRRQQMISIKLWSKIVSSAGNSSSSQSQLDHLPGSAHHCYVPTVTGYIYTIYPNPILACAAAAP